MAQQLLLWGGVAAVAVGVPLLVLRALRRADARPKPEPIEDVWAFQRRKGLTYERTKQLQAAMTYHRWIDDDELRAVALERIPVELEGPRMTKREQRIMRRGWWIYLALIAVYIAVTGRADVLIVMALTFMIYSVGPIWRRRRLERTLALNRADANVVDAPDGKAPGHGE